MDNHGEHFFKDEPRIFKAPAAVFVSTPGTRQGKELVGNVAIRQGLPEGFDAFVRDLGVVEVQHG